jgi:hypothetical protein
MLSLALLDELQEWETARKLKEVFQYVAYQVKPSCTCTVDCSTCNCMVDNLCTSSLSCKLSCD